MVDKPTYKKQGVYKGMQGTVIEHEGKCWFLVDFSPSIEEPLFCEAIGNDLRIIKKQ